MAPPIMVNAITAPSQMVLGTRISTAAIASITPAPILPQGSSPNVEKMNTDSGAAVNLKYSVCTNTAATRSCRIQLSIARDFPGGGRSDMETSLGHSADFATIPIANGNRP